jgi:hypothetical protein
LASLCAFSYVCNELLFAVELALGLGERTLMLAETFCRGGSPTEEGFLRTKGVRRELRREEGRGQTMMFMVRE